MLKKFLKTLYVDPVRVICISLVLYAYLVAGQIAYIFLYPDSAVNPWITRATNNLIVIFAIFVGIPLLYGTFLIVGIIKNKISVLKTGLMISWIYHLGFSALNILFFSGRTSVWIFALFVGTMSLISYIHYVLVD